ncbi:MAG: Na(+)-translocating NADH-quinone reductase subunit A [Bacteroidota bacterium]
MSQTIKLKKGFDIKIAGAAGKRMLDFDQPETFAIKPTDFHGLARAKVIPKVGDNVKAGTPVAYDKALESVMLCAPVSGEIVDIVRGEKRKVLEVRILADKEIEYESFPSYSVSDLSGISSEDIVGQMCKSGVWASIIQRPYGVMADPATQPKAIFISAFDSNPLAPDYDFMLDGDQSYFQAGIQILKKLTSGVVHLNIDMDAEVSKLFTSVEGVQINKFKGPHPAGNVGVQIHHLDPINKGEVAWTISPYGVIQVGKLFLEGKYDASKTIAVTGSSMEETGYVKTYVGAQVGKFIEGRTNEEHVRVISGNVLTGESVGKEGYLGFFDSQLTIIPEGDEEEFLGWILPTTSKLSFHRSFGLLSFLNGSKEFKVDTNTHGEQRGFVMSGAFEQVMPMDVLPTYLFKAILANDYDEIEALGIYELIEEDVALCEFIDVSKNDLQAILREGIELIRNS